MRKMGTTVLGESYGRTDLISIWQKGRPIPGYSPETWRADPCNRVMKFDAYGDRQSPHGWEVDHILPVSRGGQDSLSNLQPLHWQSNVAKGDNFPHWSCEIRAQ